MATARWKRPIGTIHMYRYGAEEDAFKPQPIGASELSALDFFKGAGDEETEDDL